MVGEIIHYYQNEQNEFFYLPQSQIKSQINRLCVSKYFKFNIFEMR